MLEDPSPQSAQLLETTDLVAAPSHPSPPGKKTTERQPTPPLTSAQRQAVTQQEPLVRSLSRRHARQRGGWTAHELFQVGMLALVLKAHAHDPARASFSSFARVVAKGAMLNALKRAGRRWNREVEDTEETPLEEHALDDVGTVLTSSPEALVTSAREVETRNTGVASAMASLTTDERGLVQLHDIEDVSLAEAARRMNLTYRQAQRRHACAHAKLEKRLLAAGLGPSRRGFAHLDS